MDAADPSPPGPTAELVATVRPLDFVAVVAQWGLVVGIPLGLAFRRGNAPLPLWADLALGALLAFDAAMLYRRFQALKRPAGVTDLLGFAVDLLAALPVARITGVPVADLVRLLKVTRLVGRLRLPTRMGAAGRTSIRLSIFALWSMLTVHALACGWIAIHPATLLAPRTAYLDATYWCITTLTTVGYGDVTPTTSAQKLYTMVVMVLGVGVYGIVIGNVASLLRTMDQARSQYTSSLDRLSGFLRYRKVPPELQHRLLDYYEYLWEQRRGFDESAVLDGLPAALREELAVVLRQDVVSKVPFLADAASDLKREICIALRPRLARPGDVIFRHGEIGRQMFFVASGVVAFEDETGAEFDRLGEGHFFGELALLHGRPRRAGARAVDFCDLYVLDKNVFDAVLRRHPAFAEHVKSVADERLRGPAGLEE